MLSIINNTRKVWLVLGLLVSAQAGAMQQAVPAVALRPALQTPAARSTRMQKLGKFVLYGAAAYGIYRYLVMPRQCCKVYRDQVGHRYYAEIVTPASNPLTRWFLGTARHDVYSVTEDLNTCNLLTTFEGPFAADHRGGYWTRHMATITDVDELRNWQRLDEQHRREFAIRCVAVLPE